MSSRSLGLLAGVFVSQAKSSPASWRLISSGSSVRNRMRPAKRTLSGRFSILRCKRDSITLWPHPNVSFYRFAPWVWELRCFAGVNEVGARSRNPECNEGSCDTTISCLARFPIKLHPPRVPSAVSLWSSVPSVVNLSPHRAGQWFQITSRKDLPELVQERVVYQSIRSQSLAAVDLKGPSVEIADLSSRLFDDQHTRGCVPGIEIKFPEAIKASAGHAAQIKSSRSRAPHPMRSQRDLVIKINVRILVTFVTGKSCRDKRFRQTGDLRHANSLPTQIRPASLFR